MFGHSVSDVKKSMTTPKLITPVILFASVILLVSCNSSSDDEREIFEVEGRNTGFFVVDSEYGAHNRTITHYFHLTDIQTARAGISNRVTFKVTTSTQIYQETANSIQAIRPQSVRSGSLVRVRATDFREIPNSPNKEATAIEILILRRVGTGND